MQEGTLNCRGNWLQDWMWSERISKSGLAARNNGRHLRQHGGHGANIRLHGAR